MGDLSLFKLFKQHVDEYNLASFVDGSLIKMVSNFVQSYSMTTESAEIDIRAMILNIGGEELLVSSEFCSWLYNSLPEKLKFDISDSDRVKLSESRKKMGRDFLRKCARIFPEYVALVNTETEPKFNREFLKVSPHTDLKPIDFDNSMEKIFLNLHFYQKNAKYELFNSLILGNAPSALLQLPTGAGKTKTAVEFLIDYLRILDTSSTNRRKVIWVSHSSELCQQSKDSFVSCWKYRGDREINIVEFFGKSKIDDLIKKDVSSDSIVFASFQKMHSQLKKNTVQFDSFFEDTAFIVIDEAHISTAPTYLDVLEKLQSYSNNVKLLGLTATPGRSKVVQDNDESKFLAEIYSRNLVTLRDSKGHPLDNPIAYLQNLKYLAKLDFKSLEVTSKAVKGQENDLLLINGERNLAIVLETKELLNTSSKVMLFAGSVQHARFLNSAFQYLNISSAVIDSDMSRSIRSGLLEEFKNGDLELMINYGVLSTGVDIPKLEAVVIARPITSIVLFSQIIGRALRGINNGGREKNTILSLQDNVIGSPDFIYKYWKENWFN
jgi:superfamily II DNA or RNA helicase